MREKWDKKKTSNTDNDGQPIPQKFNTLPDSNYVLKQPKLLTRTTSRRAITNYNNLSILDSQNSYENLNFIPENGNVDINNYDEPYNTSTIDSNTYSESKNSVFPTYDLYDYTTLGSLSVTTRTSNNESELGSDKNEMGSTAELVGTKMQMPCRSWFTHLEAFLCTIALSAGFGNLYRLPQMTLIRGGLPFLTAYVILTILIGLPLLFLELGIGQLAQEGFIKSWRAVPFFKGVGYVKLLAGSLLSVYYPLYMALSLYYVIWMAKGPLPFSECAVVKMKQTGYSASGIDGQQCLKKTFLESPSEDPFWYGIFAAILFVTWIIVTILSIRRTKSFIRSLSILLFPILACLIALTVKSVFSESEHEILEEISDTIDWTILKESWVWYHATIQVFFSTNVGFGTFVTNAGIIYNKVNPLWTALGYIFINLIFGVGSVMISYILNGNINITAQEGDVAELHLISVIYTAVIKSEDSSEAKIWAIIAYAAFILSGFISMATVTYTLLKAITVQNKRRLKWWQTSMVLSFIGLVLSCAILLAKDFQLVHLLDHYIVGNLILISVIIEVFAFIAFYGTERIKSDFEFMLGHILSKVWLILWWILPLILTAIFAWALITLPHEDIYIEGGETTLIQDPEWLYATGWAIVLTATIFIFAMGVFTVLRQDGYTFFDKFKASVKPSHNWGPKDPMLRHTWVQWNTKAQQGERDFTLKRKGTRDYTRSVKRNAKKAANDSTLNRATLEKKNDQNQNIRTSNSSVEYIEPYYLNNEHNSQTLQIRMNENPLRVTSLVDTLGRPENGYGNVRNTYHGTTRTNMNPLSRTHTHEFQDGSNSDSNGTFRKGPYVIPDGGNIVHVCHRRYSESEDATEL